MSLTLEEIKEKLLRLYDPDDFLESLQISSEEILDRFEDKLIRLSLIHISEPTRPY